MHAGIPTLYINNPEGLIVFPVSLLEYYCLVYYFLHLAAIFLGTASLCTMMLMVLSST